jgi:hypothetical protein
MALKTHDMCIGVVSTQTSQVICAHGVKPVQLKLKPRPHPNLKIVEYNACLWDALGHTEDTYWMWDPKTGGIHELWDIIWLTQMYYKDTNDPTYVKLNVNLVSVQADEEDESASSSHSICFDQVVQQVVSGLPLGTEGCHLIAYVVVKSEMLLFAVDRMYASSDPRLS